MKKTKWILVVGILGLLLLLPTAVFANGSKEKGAATSGAKKYKVALSMSYIGNDWQSEARDILLAMWQLHYKDKISALDVYVAGTDAANQNRQLLQMIAKGYNMIIVYPISPTALNATLQKAVDAGIVVFTYDSQVTNPNVYQITFDQKQAAERATEWLAKAMNYTGNVVLDSGVPGTTVDNLRNEGVKNVIAKYPNMKIVAQYWGYWAQGPSETGMAKILAAGTKVDGVFSQGGSVGIVKAMQDAHAKLVPMANESENQIRLDMMDPKLKAQGFSGCSYGSPPYQSAAALEYGLKVLGGDKSIPHFILIPYPFVTEQTLKLTTTGSAEDMKNGANVFAANLVGPGFFADWYSPEFTPGLDLQMALTGLIPQAQ